MLKILRGVHEFQTSASTSHRELMADLARGQQPQALFITCSDSRIVPSLITQTDPGDLFILRNAGNIVPPYRASNGGEGATIEYAVNALEVRDIIVCGHRICGAMRGLLSDRLESLPALEEWLRHADSTRQILRSQYQDLEGDALVEAAAQVNVLVQLDHLRTHPSVAARLAAGDLRLHGWVYDFVTGQMVSYHAEERAFLPMTEAYRLDGDSHRPHSGLTQRSGPLLSVRPGESRPAVAAGHG